MGPCGREDVGMGVIHGCFLFVFDDNEWLSFLRYYRILLALVLIVACCCFLVRCVISCRDGCSLLLLVDWFGVGVFPLSVGV